MILWWLSAEQARAQGEREFAVEQRVERMGAAVRKGKQQRCGARRKKDCGGGVVKRVCVGIVAGALVMGMAGAQATGAAGSQATSAAGSQALRVGDAFPQVTAKALDGGVLRLPNGHEAVVMVGFTQASGNDSAQWNVRLAKDFPAVEADDLIVLDAVPGLMRGMITAAVRHGMTPQRQAHSAVIVKEGAMWRARAQGADLSHAVAFVVDARGRVSAIVSGPVSDAGYARLKAAVAGSE